MNSHVTERNTQIIAAYTAGNRNKSELARYFGVSATTVRRVLAGVVMTMTATSAAHADLLKDYTDMGFSNFTAKWVNMTASEQATVREALRSEGHENLLIDLGDKLNQSAPEIIQPAPPQATPHTQTITPTLTAQLTPQATPQATPQKLAVAPTLTTQLTPQATPQATPQKLAVAPTLTAQLTPQATPQATPQKMAVAPTLTAQLTPQATPQATPQKLAVAPTLTEQSTVEKTPIRAANSSTVQEVTSTPAQQPVVKQKVRSTYYDKQITALNAAAEQEHAEVLAESHSRAVGDANTLSQANDYTNKKFSDLKSEVDDNKDQANAGTASALAAVGIPQVEAGSDFMVGAGAGTYGNQSAIAVGVSGHITAKTVTKLAVTGDTNNGVGASAGIGWNF